MVMIVDIGKGYLAARFLPGLALPGLALDREKTLDMLRRHSALHGWHPETGIPTEDTLIGLGLKEVADRLKGTQGP